MVLRSAPLLGTGTLLRPSPKAEKWGVRRSVSTRVNAMLSADVADEIGADLPGRGPGAAARDKRWRNPVHAAFQPAHRAGQSPGREVPAVPFGDVRRDGRPPARRAHRRSALRPHGSVSPARLAAGLNRSPGRPTIRAFATQSLLSGLEPAVAELCGRHAARPTVWVHAA